MDIKEYKNEEQKIYQEVATKFKERFGKSITISDISIIMESQSRCALHFLKKELSVQVTGVGKFIVRELKPIEGKLVPYIVDNVVEDKTNITGNPIVLPKRTES